MSNHQQHFNSNYPIICAGMNKVSNVELALAVKQAGCYPSLVAFNHLVMLSETDVATDDIQGLDDALTEYKKIAGDSNYILGVSCNLLKRKNHVLDLIHSHKPAYIELFDLFGFSDHEFYNIIRNLQTAGVKVLVKVPYLDRFLKFKMVWQMVDGVIIKGDKGAGRVTTSVIDLTEQVRILRDLRDDWIIIAQGGVHDSAGITELLNAGATAVSMGTVFALSEESPIPTETKLKMVASSYTDTVKIGQANQNALVFTKTDNDVENNTIGLTNGLKTATIGHVFVGAALDHIDQIKPVSQIVAELTMGL
jgi:NAD(P)H-dependent flavin oxidoreductase YrpB (nitropropane dioxygenase family)